MTLHQLLNQRAEQYSAEDLLTRMGYQNIGPNQLQRLETVLADEYLGLGVGHFDFHYNSRQFIEALCIALDLDPNEHSKALDDIEAFLRGRNFGFKPWLQVTTDFKRSGQSLLSLGGLSRLLRISLEGDFWALPEIEQVARAQKVLRQHMRDTGGSLMMWGKITGYRLHLAKDRAVLFAPTGMILGEYRGGARPVVQISLAGQRLL